MPEEVPPVTTPEQPDVKTDEESQKTVTTLDEAAKKEIKEAKSSLLKKILLWGGGILMAILTFIGGVIGILYLLKGKGPISGVKESVENSKQQIAKADMEEKIKIAEAKNAEKAVIDKLHEIKEIKDETTRLEELNKLL